MKGEVDGAWSTRFWAIALLSLCLFALAPSVLLAYFGWLWLPGLAGRSFLSAAALAIGPLPFAVGAVLAWQAQRRRQSLIAGACVALLSIPLYAIALAWGGRMLL